jgi:hypothetical protein
VASYPAYCPDGTGGLSLHTLQVLTVTADGVARNVVFQDPAVFQPLASSPFSPGNRGGER